jgi:hypothetical protein
MRENLLFSYHYAYWIGSTLFLIALDIHTYIHTYNAYIHTYIHMCTHTHSLSYCSTHTHTYMCMTTIKHNRKFLACLESTISSGICPQQRAGCFENRSNMHFLKKVPLYLVDTIQVLQGKQN